MTGLGLPVDFLKRVPIVPTLLVLLAIGVMLRLGFWQLDRMHQKEALIAGHALAARQAEEVAWPSVRGQAGERELARLLYRRSRLDCRKVIAQTTRSGLNARDEAGVAQVASCRKADGAMADVVLGWSRDPAPVPWPGGVVTGWIAPGPRLVADPPLAGLDANARPDPSTIPNNHLSYAVQWFLFAAAALVIYALALRKRLAAGGASR